MHLHILGICGTFMGGIALIARAAGHRVTGCDANVYPPMSDQLAASGIGLINGWNADQIALNPDVYVIGNAVTRGNPLMEEILDRGFPYVSGPQWLRENVLPGKWVVAVAGTHGKTTTASMLAWILEAAGLAPGFLIGGVPGNFGVSARLSAPHPGLPPSGGRSAISLPRDGGGSEWGERSFFVVEADEYDTAYFDKRSKFLHYPARTTILNNLEFDHADIFPDLAAIETQFHHFVRTLPASGLMVVNGADEALARVLARGCYTPVERFGGAAGWSAGEPGADGFAVSRQGAEQGRVRWSLTGAHNRSNALAAIAAARHCGVDPRQAIAALATFEGVKRRMEVRGTVNGITVYDDFAHHPTAIETTIEGLRAKVGQRQDRLRAGAPLEHDESGNHEGSSGREPRGLRPRVLLQCGARVGRARGAGAARREGGRGRRLRPAGGRSRGGLPARRPRARHEQRGLQRHARETAGAACRGRLGPDQGTAVSIGVHRRLHWTGVKQT